MFSVAQRIFKELMLCHNNKQSFQSMRSFLYQSYERFMPSNSLPIDRLIISPLFLPRYTEDNHDNLITPFKENTFVPSQVKTLFFSDMNSTLDLPPKKPKTQPQTHTTAQTIPSNAKSSLFVNGKSKIEQPQPKVFYDSLYIQPQPDGRQILLNQLVINDRHIKYFPMINLPEDELRINIILPLEENNSLRVIPNALKRKILIDLDIINKDEELQLRFKLFKKDLQLDEQYDSDFTSPKAIVKYFYDRIKHLIQNIQLNYLLQKRKTINENLLFNCQKMIDKCNEIAEIFLFKPPTCRVSEKSMEQSKECELNYQSKNNEPQRKDVRLLNRKTKPRDNDSVLSSSLESNSSEGKDNEMKCKFCSRLFSNGCALGGHMSRVHPHKSEQYKRKIKIRENRNEFRAAINESKKILCEQHGLSYEYFNMNPKTKKELKKLIRFNKKEYCNILKKTKASKGLLNPK